MKNQSKYQKGRFAIFLLYLYLVFVLKSSKKIFTDRVLQHLEKIFRDICTKFDASLEEFNREKDHVHLLMAYPPKFSVSSIVNALKGVSSRMLCKNDYPETRRNLWGKVFGLQVVFQLLVEVDRLMRFENILKISNKLSSFHPTRKRVGFLLGIG